MNHSSLAQHEVQSLALIRRLLLEAEEEAESPFPLSSLSLMTAHTSVEWFLGLGAEHYEVEAGNFMEHWNEFDQQAGIALPQKAGMDRLNEVRADLKHLGSIPDESQIHSLLNRTREFLEAATPRVFSVNLSEVSLSILISDDEIRERVEAADQELEDSNPAEAVSEAAKAMHLVLNLDSAHEKLVPGEHNRMSERDLGRLTEDLDRRDLRPLGRALRKELDGIHEVLELLTLGVDLKEYVWFDRVTPEIIQTMDGQLHVTWSLSSPDDVSLEDARECIDFVTETAISAHELSPSDR